MNNLSDPLTVVIIEDEQAIADTLVHVLEMDGFQTVWFATAGEGLAFLQQNSAALLVLDGMAEMFVLGCTVDYIKEFGGSYLTVNNPNAHSSCGCGTSFSIKV